MERLEKQAGFETLTDDEKFDALSILIGESVGSSYLEVCILGNEPKLIGPERFAEIIDSIKAERKVTA